MTSIPTFEEHGFARATVADLRSDHAGETGAVHIYYGVLAVASDPQVRRFARQHLDAERRHLAFFEDWLPQRHHSRLLPLWRLAGWLTGALPALFGAKAVFSTIAAVEQFVDGHYARQIRDLEAEPGHRPLAAVLERFRAEEAHHRDDALERLREDRRPGWWQRIVGLGSAVGVALARRV